MLGYLFLLEQCRKGLLGSSLALFAGHSPALLAADQVGCCRNALDFFLWDEKLVSLKTLCVYILCLTSGLKLNTEIVSYWPFLERKEFDVEKSTHAMGWLLHPSDSLVRRLVTAM